jgi:hypothetical protein
MTYRKCPKKFEYMYKDADYFNYNTDDESQTDEQRKGSLFHQAVDLFFTKQIGRVFTVGLHETFRDAFPVGTEIDRWYEWFADIEAKRYQKLCQMDKLGMFIPIAREIEVRMDDVIPRIGHIDRIDIDPETEDLIIVEYKTGKSYNMENKYAVTDMNAEIGFYVKIINSTNMFPNKKVTKWMVINPTLEKVWVNNISPVTLKVVDETFGIMVRKINNKEEFDRNIGVLCDYCPYVDDCLFENKPLIEMPEEITYES